MVCHRLLISDCEPIGINCCGRRFAESLCARGGFIIKRHFSVLCLTRNRITIILKNYITCTAHETKRKCNGVCGRLFPSQSPPLYLKPRTELNKKEKE